MVFIKQSLVCYFIISSADMSVVKANIDVLVMEGLGPRADTDFLLARDTCLALLKLGVPKTVSTVLDYCIK